MHRTTRQRSKATNTPAGWLEKSPAAAVSHATESTPGLEINAWIDHRVHHIADNLHHQAKQRENVKCAEHNGIVPLNSRLKAKQAQSVQGKHDLHQQRGGEQDAHERLRETCHDQKHCVAKYMTVQHSGFAGSL